MREEDEEQDGPCATAVSLVTCPGICRTAIVHAESGNASCRRRRLSVDRTKCKTVSHLFGLPPHHSNG